MSSASKLCVVLARFFVVLVYLAAFAAGVAAQSTVTINGTVRDQSGAAIPGATVTATNVKTGIAATAPTDADGHYTVLSIDAGFYDVQAAQQGFATTVRRNEEFLVGTTVTIDFALQVSSVQQTVEVQGAVAEVEPTQNVVTSVLHTDQLDDLPILSRNFSELASLTPGVQSTSQTSVAFAVGGAVIGVTIGNSTQYLTGYMVDDVPVVKPSDGGLYVALAQDWVQEFSVNASQIPAEYIGASSGVVNAITRSGSNDIHGRAYGFFQNSTLNASSVDPNPATPITSKAPTSSQRVGGMVGGAIKKDKLFYFVGYEYFRSLTGVSFTGAPAVFAGTTHVLPGDTVPATPSNLNRQDLAEVKISYQINPSNSLDLIGNIGEIGEPNIVAGGTTSRYNGNSTRVGDYQETANWKHIFSPTAINALRFASARDWDDEKCLYAEQVGPYPTSTPAITSFGVNPFGNPTGYYAALSYPAATANGLAPSSTNPSVGTVTLGCNGRWGGDHFIGLYAGIYDTFTKTKGRHEIKFGGDAGDPYYGLNGTRVGYDGTYTFASTQFGPFMPNAACSSGALSACTFPQRYTATWAPPGHTYDMATGWNFGFFAQDTWRVTDNMTFNMGIRWDGDLSYSYFNAHNIAPDGNPVNNDFRTVAPRFGMAWTPFKDKTTVIRGGFGLFYAPTSLTEANGYIVTRTLPQVIDAFVANSTSGNPYCISPGGCTSTVPANLQLDLQALMAWALVNNTIPDLTKTSVTVGGTTYALPGFVGTIPKSGVYNIDQNKRDPGAIQATIGMAHSFNNGLSFTADFVYMHGFDEVIMANSNINPQQPLTSTGAANPAFTNFGPYWNLGNGGWFSDRQFLGKVRYTDHRGDFGEVAYTLGWSFSNSPAGADFNEHAITVLSTDPLNFDVDKGPSSTDQRHIVAVNGNIRLPGGIEFAPILTFSTGLPLTPTTTLAAGGSQTLTNGVVVNTPGCLAYYSACYPARNGLLYTKGSLRGSDSILLNARVQRVFKITESKSITPMFEAYNIPNITNIGTNYTVLATSTSFDTPSTSTIVKRQLQLGVRFDF